MPVIDDTLLALIARFVVDDVTQLSVSDESFLSQQVEEIKRHVQHVPDDQRQQAVMSWIQDYAERYREQWKRKVLSDMLRDEHCSDCPIVHNSQISHCIIHKRWNALLREYIKGDIDSEKYIEETLQLLNEHKAKLKISQLSSRLN